MRDVEAGWLLHYMHANGASMFLIVVYLHIFCGLYHVSYSSPREFVWCLGVVIFLLMIVTSLWSDELLGSNSNFKLTLKVPLLEFKVFFCLFSDPGIF